jgi:RNA polymerase sigma-70 factor, ECF subfamily
VRPAKHILPGDECTLINEARTGNDAAFTKLVKKYENLVYSFAYKVCRDTEKAEETWQDTFINVYRKLHQFDGKSKFTTWLYSIVANNCRMKRRKSKLETASISFEEPLSSYEQADTTERPSQTIPVWHDTPLKKIMDAELKSHLDDAIKQLPYEYRIVFVLRDIEGQSAEETGKILKLSVPAVKSRLRRARVFLREQLHEYMTT